MPCAALMVGPLEGLRMHGAFRSLRLCMVFDKAQAEILPSLVFSDVFRGTDVGYIGEK